MAEHLKVDWRGFKADLMCLNLGREKELTVKDRISLAGSPAVAIDGPGAVAAGDEMSMGDLIRMKGLRPRSLDPDKDSVTFVVYTSSEFVECSQALQESGYRFNPTQGLTLES
jgi:hypothetical protein